jgi:hypothetical protein
MDFEWEDRLRDRARGPEKSAAAESKSRLPEQTPARPPRGDVGCAPPSAEVAVARSVLDASS